MHRKTPDNQPPQIYWHFRWFLEPRKKNCWPGIDLFKLSASKHSVGNASTHLVPKCSFVHVSNLVEDTSAHKRRYLSGLGCPQATPERAFHPWGGSEQEQWFSSTSPWRNPIHPLSFLCFKLLILFYCFLVNLSFVRIYSHIQGGYK